MRVKKEIPVKLIQIDRIPLDNKTLEYATKLKDGTVFPAIKVAKLDNGLFEIRDGRHRLIAHKLCGIENIFAKFSTKTLKRI